MIKLTIEQLKNLVATMDNQNTYHNMRKDVFVSIKKHPSGEEYLEFEQPCHYAEYNSKYYRYDQSEQA